MKKLRVVKFGGSSVSALTMEGLASKLERYCQTTGTRKLICVLSAERSATDEYLVQVSKLNSKAPVRERDSMLSIGEHYSVTRAALAATNRGINCVSLLGWQVGLRTTSPRAGRSYIESIDTDALHRYLEDYDWLFVAGFQGISKQNDITTLGRGGSDITAVALSAALNQKECLIVSDEKGIYRADPRIIGDTSRRPIEAVHYDEALELATLGTKIVQPRAVELAMNYKVRINIACFDSFESGEPGTTIRNLRSVNSIAGIALSNEEALLEIGGLPDEPGTISKLLQYLFEKTIDLDLITQSEANVNSASRLICTASTLDLQPEQLDAVVTELREHNPNLAVECSHSICKVSLVGRKIESTPGLVAKIREYLMSHGIHPYLVGGPKNRISLVLPSNSGEKTVKLLYKLFFEKSLNEQ